MSISQLHTIPEAFLDLVEDLPSHQLAAFAQDLRALTREKNPTRNEVIALRIAGDDENFGDNTPTVVAFHVVLQLVERGHLSEDNIGRYVDEGAR